MNKNQCHALITEEFARFKEGESTQEARLALAYKLTDEYYDQYGDYPHPTVLERLATLLLVEELADRNPHKASVSERPFYTQSQEDVRKQRERAVVEITYNDRQYMGRKTSHYTDDDGTPQVTKSRLIRQR